MKLKFSRAALRLASLACIVLLQMSSPLAKASNHCEIDHVFLFRGISCCLGPRLSKQTCVEKVEGLPPRFLEMIQTVRDGFAEHGYHGSGPNCFWSALGFHLSQYLEEPRTVYEREFVPELRNSFTLIEADKLDYGDLLSFTQSHPFDPDPTMGAELIFVEIPFHSAIYLGGGLVIQKENFEDEVFSLNTLDNSFSAYAEAAFRQLRLETNLKVYRMRGAPSPN